MSPGDPPSRNRSSNADPSRLAKALTELSQRYETAEALAADPLAEVRSYTNAWDRELAGWVAAHLAYGRVGPMRRAIRTALDPLGPQPSIALRTTSPRELQAHLRAHLQGWRWRFHTSEDLLHWLLAWQRLDAETGGQGLEGLLLPPPGSTHDEALSNLIQRLRRELPPTPGLRFNLPDPLEGAACKRWRMFLRWMVRSGWPDLGLWKQHPTSILAIPLDTHVTRISRYLGLTMRRSVDARTVIDITTALRALDSDDPLRFDFGLSHLGILGHCPGHRRLPDCAPCPLWALCQAR